MNPTYRHVLMDSASLHFQTDLDLIYWRFARTVVHCVSMKCFSGQSSFWINLTVSFIQYVHDCGVLLVVFVMTTEEIWLALIVFPRSESFRSSLTKPVPCFNMKCDF